MKLTPIQSLAVSQSQQIVAPTQRPIFAQNPLTFLIDNEYSGTLHINNLVHVNKLYELMKEALLQENNINNAAANLTTPGTNSANINSSNIINTNNMNQSRPQTVLFTTTNTNTKSASSSNLISKPNKLFDTVKGNKIFNITKEPHPNNRIKSVRIIYKNEEEYINNPNNHHNYNYEYQNEEENKEDHFIQHKQEEFLENREEEEEIPNENEEEYYENHPEEENYFGSYPKFMNFFK
jgi:hypothetical protein